MDRAALDRGGCALQGLQCWRTCVLHTHLIQKKSSTFRFLGDLTAPPSRALQFRPTRLCPCRRCLPPCPRRVSFEPPCPTPSDAKKHIFDACARCGQGNIAKWRKSEGDKVSAGEVLAEIETASLPPPT